MARPHIGVFQLFEPWKLQQPVRNDDELWRLKWLKWLSLLDFQYIQIIIIMIISHARSGCLRNRFRFKYFFLLQLEKFESTSSYFFSLLSAFHNLSFVESFIGDWSQIGQFERGFFSPSFLLLVPYGASQHRRPMPAVAVYGSKVAVFGGPAVCVTLTFTPVIHIVAVQIFF